MHSFLLTQMSNAICTLNLNDVTLYDHTRLLTTPYPYSTRTNIHMNARSIFVWRVCKSPLNLSSTCGGMSRYLGLKFLI